MELKSNPWRRLKTALSITLQAFKEAVFPPRCLVCDGFFTPPDRPFPADRTSLAEFLQKPDETDLFRRVAADVLCPACRDGFMPVTPPVCPVCGLMFKSREGPDHMCGQCIRRPRRFRAARAAGVYEQVFMDLIHALKYQGKLRAADSLALVLLCRFLRHWRPEDVDVLMPVPLHIRKLRQRGFNQALLLIRDWPGAAARFGADVSCIRIDWTALVRIRETRSQVGVSREDRIRNIRGAFAVVRPETARGKRILLIDDVLTTGSTADECARVLAQSGAASVDVLTLAQTPKLL